MSDPFLITGSAVISFSGGRTSAYMLWRILQAHGGTLPEDVVVCFANTGREMPATLDFVAECASRWNVPVVWLEYRWQPGAHGFEVVSHNSASRAGEPFEMALRAKSYLPNPVARFCIAELKVRTTRRYLRAALDWTTYINVIGLRADEPDRVTKAHDPKKHVKDGYVTTCPLAFAGVDKVGVLRFWRDQPFDLRLAGPWEGNCDGCYLKSRGAIMRMLADHPKRMAWWAEQEAQPRGAGAGATFRVDREDYSTMARAVRDQGVLPMTWLEEALPCTSGGCGI